MERNDKETFTYTYSAKEQKEIQAIRQKYAAPAQAQDKLGQLRRLDAAVTRKAQTVSLAFGVIGALVLGSGMSLAMTDLGGILGLDSVMAMAVGILLGGIGMVLVGAAYPVYNRILKKERAKIAPEILRLSDELMK
ncbi:MAG: hypothetical protein IJ281_01605 [Clostridia bacterium]|nr:hypothetical protein [Clostridia bacterium]